MPLAGRFCGDRRFFELFGRILAQQFVHFVPSSRRAVQQRFVRQRPSPDLVDRELSKFKPLMIELLIGLRVEKVQCRVSTPPIIKRFDVGEKVGARLGFAPVEVRPVEPFPDADRHLLVARKIAPTDPAFPRRPGRATARPLAG